MVVGMVLGAASASVYTDPEPMVRSYSSSFFRLVVLGNSDPHNFILFLSFYLCGIGVVIAEKKNYSLF